VLLAQRIGDTAIGVGVDCELAAVVLAAMLEAGAVAGGAGAVVPDVGVVAAIA
jgi:hypothetical protein